MDSKINANSKLRRNRLLLVISGLVILVVLVIMARGALLPLAVSAILAYLLFPAVRILENNFPWNQKWPHGTRIGSITVIYFLALTILAGSLAVVVPPAFKQASEFINEIPVLFEDARQTVENWNNWYTDKIPADVRIQIEEILEDQGAILIDAGQSVIGKTLGTVTNTFTTVIGLAIVPFMLFYLLKDRETATKEIYAIMPSESQKHAKNIVDITNRVLGSYIRAQLTLGVIVGTVVSVGLYFLGIKFSVLLGLVAGVTELIPVIGPLLGAVPGILVTLASSPEKILWVLSLYVGIQLIENTLLVPRIQGHAVQMHPIIIMLVLVVGSEAAGLFGVIISVPLAAVSRDVFKYFYKEWSSSEGLSNSSVSEPINDDIVPADNSH